MDITVESVRDTALLVLEGDFTYTHRKELARAVGEAEAAGCRHLILDLEQVPFIDSAGLGALVLTAHRVTSNKGRICLMRPQSAVREILALANIHKIIPIHETLEDALPVE